MVARGVSPNAQRRSDGRRRSDRGQYAANLEANLQRLLDRAKSGSYRAPPVRRVHIPKGNGREMRPLGIPTFEDKVLQRAVVMVLEAVYEQDFLDCSYGFRPGRSAHHALEASGIVTMASGRRVGARDRHPEVLRRASTTGTCKRCFARGCIDGVLLRLIGKWLNAGVMENGASARPHIRNTTRRSDLADVGEHLPACGARQWFERDVKPRLTGHARLSATRTMPCWSSRRGGCTARAGSAAKALREIRADAAPEKTTDRVSHARSTASRRTTERTRHSTCSASLTTGNQQGPDGGS